jgi:hypothetical protein
MKRNVAQAHQTCRRIPLLACIAALVGVLRFAIPHLAHANRDLVSPPVPLNLEVSVGNKLFLVGHAIGTQQYICLPSGLSSLGHCSDRRQLYSTTRLSKSSPISSAPTRPRMACLAPLGSIQTIPARSGLRRSPHLRTLTSSRRTRFPGSCLRCLEINADPPAAAD